MVVDPLKIVFALLQPLGLTLLLCVAAVLFAHWLLRALALTAVVVTAVISTPWAADQLAASLNARYPDQPVEQYGRSQAIVLLGGGVRPAADGSRGTDATAAVDRILRAAELWKAGKAPRIIVTGAYGTGSWTEAHAMRHWLQVMGVPSEVVVLEPEARNTRQHPAKVRALLDDADAAFLLVTSALHMPRAIANFRAAGLRPIAAPADFELLRYDNVLDWLPDTQALHRSTRVLKEHLGLLHQRVFGG
ncbi:YdcF family protein [Algiphilus sp.]|uniref:YdcF family protein n=1 Tax=Algiphilus sp. TaxID=1872431 RepID=UPI003B522A77